MESTFYSLRVNRGCPLLARQAFAFWCEPELRMRKTSICIHLSQFLAQWSFGNLARHAPEAVISQLTSLACLVRVDAMTARC